MRFHTRIIINSRHKLLWHLCNFRSWFYEYIPQIKSIFTLQLLWIRHRHLLGIIMCFRNMMTVCTAIQIDFYTSIAMAFTPKLLWYSSENYYVFAVILHRNFIGLHRESNRILCSNCYGIYTWIIMAFVWKLLCVCIVIIHRNFIGLHRDANRIFCRNYCGIYTWIIMAFVWKLLCICIVISHRNFIGLAASHIAFSVASIMAFISKLLWHSSKKHYTFAPWFHIASLWDCTAIKIYFGTQLKSILRCSSYSL
jgi:hypothetical protein